MIAISINGVLHKIGTALRRCTSDEIPGYYYYLFGFIAALFVLFYLYYSFSGWFFQDDISYNFAFNYTKYFQFKNIFVQHSAFRFLSIDCYWFFLHKFFGNTASLYFIFNLLLLCVNSIIVFFFIRDLSRDGTIALFTAVIYLIMPATIKNMTWICNNQHLMSHFFAFLFCHIYFNKGGIDNLHARKGIFLTLLLLSTLLSNFLAAFFIPCIIFYHILYWNEVKLRKSNIFFLVFWGLILLGFIIISAKFTVMLQSPGYGIDISIGTFIKTLQTYSFHIYKNLPLLVITIVLVLAIGIIKKDKQVIFFIASSVCFYLPYSFAVFQRNINYLAISYLFYCVSIIILLKKYVRIPALLLLFFLYNVYNTHTILKEYSENPAGAKVRIFILQMKEVYTAKGLNKYKKIYFKTDEVNNYKTGINAIDKTAIPVFWTRLAEGRALHMFLDQNLEYRVLQNDQEAPRGSPVIIVSKDLYRQEDAGVKRVIMPIQ